jgi:hypothetical protein
MLLLHSFLRSSPVFVTANLSALRQIACFASVVKVLWYFLCNGMMRVKKENVQYGGARLIWRGERIWSCSLQPSQYLSCSAQSMCNIYTCTCYCYIRSCEVHQYSLPQTSLPCDKSLASHPLWKYYGTFYVMEWWEWKKKTFNTSQHHFDLFLCSENSHPSNCSWVSRGSSWFV